MLSGLYSYVFGEENSIETSSSEKCMRTRTKEDDGWLLVHESASGRSSPIIIAPIDIIDIDQLSCQSNGNTTSPSTNSIRRAEVLKEARVANKLRMNLEKAMFSEPPEISNKTNDNSVISKVSAAKLKRATASTIVASESKIKNRSKKTGKLLSGVNNNRKCNNLV